VALFDFLIRKKGKKNFVEIHSQKSGRFVAGSSLKVAHRNQTHYKSHDKG